MEGRSATYKENERGKNWMVETMGSLLLSAGSRSQGVKGTRGSTLGHADQTFAETHKERLTDKLTTSEGGRQGK